MPVAAPLATLAPPVAAAIGESVVTPPPGLQLTLLTGSPNLGFDNDGSFNTVGTLRRRTGTNATTTDRT